ncbi:hypothetical protein AURDEDRAFT_185684 [Auricularia subglabra TFB-10046 SS5]|nr:hypothetical protein AURDEDRAFT_185684 [Auricularia subglabra TFB-10046 SS5]
MLEVISPDIRDPTLTPGALVLLAIDPVASVADMQDAKATAAATRLPKGRALAMVRGYDFDGMKPLHTQPLAFMFLCVGHGLPEEPPYACIGLSQEAAHPDARPPAIPSIPLPWSDCYLHLFQPCRSIITRIYPGPTGSISHFSEDELLRIMTSEFSDHARYESEVGSETEDSYQDGDSEDFEPQSDVVPPVSDEYCASAAYSTASEADPSGGSPQPIPLHRSCTSSRLSPASASGSVSNLDDKAGLVLTTSVEPDATSGDRGSRSPLPTSSGSSCSLLDSDIPKLRFRGEVWLDLTTFDDFDPPDYISQLIESLEEIENEWANRMALQMLADQPLTAKWAAEVAASAGDDNTLADVEPALEDVSEDEESGTRMLS